MAMYSFSLESFTAVACRSAGALDDVWLVITVNLGTRTADVVAWTIDLGVQPGQGFTGPWSAGPYQATVGETGVVTYTFVNLSGSSAADQGMLIAELAASLTAAVTKAAVSGPTTAVDAAIRGIFGGTGELLTAPALVGGGTDCRGLLGVYVAPFTAPIAPSITGLQTTDPITLAGTAPASCGTNPRSTAVFSVRGAPSVFSLSTPIAVLASAPATTEMFAVGMDGLVRYNLRSGSGPNASFGAWQGLWAPTFSQSAPLVALAQTAQRKDAFGTGTDGVIYTMRWTPASGWGDWSPVSVAGQFLPDTPVSAILVDGILSLFAVDPTGVAQSISWKNDAIVNSWAPLPGLQLSRRTPLTVMFCDDPWIEVFAVSSLGGDYHCSRQTTIPTWGVWQEIGQPSAIPEPSSRRSAGLKGFSSSLAIQPRIFRVDGAGNVHELGSVGQGWLARTLVGLKTAWAGSVSGGSVGNELRLYAVDVQTGRIGEAVWTLNGGTNWSAWQLLPAGPQLVYNREIVALSVDDSHAELFVVDRDGLVQHLAWAAATGWGGWSLV